jgi:hypothetical protein
MLPFLKKHGDSRSSGALRSYIRREVLMQDARRTVCSLLDSNDLSFCWVKGVPLAQKLFGNAIARYSGDIDILVQPQSFYAVCRQLLQSGWRLPAVTGGRPNAVLENSLGRWSKDILFISPDGVKLEVHHRLSITPGEVYRAYEDWLWSQSRSAPLGNSDLESLELFYLVSHGSATGFHRLKWLLDIATYLCRLQSEWAMDDDSFARVLIDQSRKYLVTRRLVVAWTLSNHYFSVPLPEPVGRLLNNDRLSLWLVNSITQFSEKPELTGGWKYRSLRRISSVWFEESLSRRSGLLIEYVRNGIANVFANR